MIRTQCCFHPVPAVVLRELHLHDRAVTTEGDALDPHRQPRRQLAAPIGHDDEGPHRHAHVADGNGLECAAGRLGGRGIPVWSVGNAVGRGHPVVRVLPGERADPGEVLDPVHAELSRHDKPNGEPVQHRQRLVVHQVGHEGVIQRRVGQIQRLHHGVGALALRPWPAVKALELQLNRSRLDADGGEQLRQADPGPAGVPHTTVSPLGARDPRLESTPTVPRTLIDGRDGSCLEVLHELIEAELERSLDVALQAEPPRAQVDGVRNEVQMIAHVERCVRGERRQKVWTRRLELDSPVGHTKERQLLRIAHERIDAVPVWIDARAGEAG